MSNIKKLLEFLSIITACSLLAVVANAQMIGDAPPAPKSPAEKKDTADDVNARDEIIYRASLGRADDVEFLIKKGGSANQHTAENVPLLSIAAGRKDPEGLNVLSILLKYGADINARDRNGQTALFYAAKKGNIEALHILLSNRADPMIIDNKGDLARTIAYNAGYNEVITVLDNAVKNTVSPAASSQVVAAAAPAVEKTLPEISPQLAETGDIPSPLVNDVPAPLPQSEETEAQKKMQQQLNEMKSSAPVSLEQMKKRQEELSRANAKSIDQETKNSPKSETETSGNNDIDTEKEIARLSYDLAYNTCGFQYWSFCSDVKQSTELESEELTVAIQSHKSKVESIKKRLMGEQLINGKLYNAIVGSAQQRVYNQLNSMRSNKQRHESGIGKMDDMMKRCGEIGRQWDVLPPGLGIKSSAPAKSDAKRHNADSSAATTDASSNTGPVAKSGGAQQSRVSSGSSSAVTNQKSVNSSAQPPLQQMRSYPEYK